MIPYIQLLLQFTSNVAIELFIGGAALAAIYILVMIIHNLVKLLKNTKHK